MLKGRAGSKKYEFVHLCSNIFQFFSHCNIFHHHHFNIIISFGDKILIFLCGFHFPICGRIAFAEAERGRIVQLWILLLWQMVEASKGYLNHIQHFF